MPNRLSVLIIEDEAPTARRLQKLLLEVEPAAVVLERLDAISSSVAWLRENSLPDLLLCDIRLADGLSFDIFTQVEVTSPVVFTTAYDEYALRAFDVNSVDYLLKPVEREALARAVSRVRLRQTPAVPPLAGLEELFRSFQTSQPTYRNRFLVTFRDTLQAIGCEEVAYFYSEHKVTHLVTRSGATFVVDPTLEELEQQLDPRKFFRVNRQVVLCAEAIRQIHVYFNGKLKLDLVPALPDEVIVSRERASIFKRWLDQ